MPSQNCQCNLIHEEIEKAIEIADSFLCWRDPLATTGIKLVDQILKSFGIVLKQESDADLTTPEGFLEWVVGSAIDLRLADRTAVERHVDSLREILNVNWPALSDSDVDGVLSEVSDLILEVRESALGIQRPIVSGAVHEVSEKAKSDWARAYDLGSAPAFNVRDRRVEDFIVNSTANFMRDRDGRIVDEFSTKAREIVASGVSQGFGRQDIADMLAEEFGRVQTTGYYSLIASQFTNSARTYGALRTMEEAGVEFAEIVAIIDERTTDICRFLDGQVISVGGSLGIYDKLSESDSPESVRETNPWIREGTDDDGRFLFIEEPDGKKIEVARVVRSGRGIADDHGKFSNALSEEQMQALGVGPPPYHPYCRTSIVPVAEEVS